MGEGIVKTDGIAAPPSGASVPMFLISVEDVDFNSKTGGRRDSSHLQMDRLKGEAALLHF